MPSFEFEALLNPEALVNDDPPTCDDDEESKWDVPCDCEHCRDDDEDAEEVDQIAYDQAAYSRTPSAQLREEW